MDFSIGDSSACVFYHAKRRLRCSVHGDDPTTSGPKRQLDWCKAELEKHYELTEAHRLGLGAKDDKEAGVLNRIVMWTENGSEYEADPRQVEKLSRDLKIDDGVKSLGTQGVRATRGQVEGDENLPEEKNWPYRVV